MTGNYSSFGSLNFLRPSKGIYFVFASLSHSCRPEKYVIHLEIGLTEFGKTSRGSLSKM